MSEKRRYLILDTSIRGRRLDAAITFAVKLHEGQFDKGGMPYILHPLHVMLDVENEIRGNPNIEHFLCAAMLHDVLEDYDPEKLTALDVRSELHDYGPEVLTAVEYLTKAHTGQTYDQYIEQVMQNRIASIVKIADLRHNLDASRIHTITGKDEERLEKYQNALARLVQHEEDLKTM